MTALDVDKALAAPIEEVGPRLCTLREDQWFDRKSIRIAAKDLAEHLVAFANAEGGVIVLGLRSGQVEGLKRSAHRLNDFQQAAIDHTEPPVRARTEQVPCINEAGEVDALVVMRIDPCDVVHELKNGDCYLRVGDESRKLKHDQRQELTYDRGQNKWDGQPLADLQVDDLHRALLDQFRTATNASGTHTRLLAARSLTTRRGLLTNAAYLLFGEHPQDEFPQAYIRVIKYLDRERGTGSRLSIEEGHDVRVEGPIPYAVQNAARVIEDWVPQRRSLRGSGLFEPAPIVPRDAWLEGMVNAVIHRSYSLAGDHIRVEIYPDRVEITSPGRFPGLADPRRPLDIDRFARNPRIARVCADLRIGQELGEGIKRIFDEMRRVGLTDPVYEQGQSSVKLTLLALPRIEPHVAARLPTRAQDVLDALRAAERDLGTGEIAERIGLSKPATKARLDALATEGLVLWVGKAAKDPRAVWRLVS
ncbi:ATP-binding protein [Curtobacterium sp. VKM Ac-2922]|uniref:ATP-binding protein n=1 Tax=Curtobacterium sp. VKM Ac-2922 TaxID=2929475 RepID=UPI001FB297F9|nr:ATP-binding protein [Curtobacterium sp. VKM Ac-2922]MCJ1714993.1 putative DNA binding domain-containing protein [Curtobacterium sp. VKM Ac-2922]